MQNNVLKVTDNEGKATPEGLAFLQEQFDAVLSRLSQLEAEIERLKAENDEAETSSLKYMRELYAIAAQLGLNCDEIRPSELHEKITSDIELMRKDHANTIHSLCNYAWQKVYGEGRTDWEYPMQAIRHLVDYAGEKEAEIEKLTKTYVHPEPVTQNPCVHCGFHIYGSYVGAGDGTMKNGGKFAHPECFEQARLKEQIASLTSSLAAATTSAVGIAKAVFDNLTCEFGNSEWCAAVSEYAFPIMEDFAQRGWLELHPDYPVKRWFRWQSSAREEGDE